MVPADDDRGGDGDRTRTQRQCWAIYRSWVDAGRAALLADPAGVDAELERLASGDAASPKQWADGYLAAFAEAAGTTLVTFDRALAARAVGSVLL